MMKDTKKILCHFSFYDQVKIQEKLEEMAEQGWMVDKPGSFMWTFKRIEPQKLRFSVTYFPGASEFDPGPTEGELTKLDFCARDGWKLAMRWGVMQIFYHEDEGAVPIETEPVAQVENVTKAMRKNVLFPHLVESAMLVWCIFLQLSMFRRDPVDYLSDTLKVYQIPVWGCLLLACLYEVGFYFWWTRKARKTAEEDGYFLPIRTKMNAGYLLLLFSAWIMILTFRGTSNYLSFILIWCGVMVLITFAANRLKGWLKKKGAHRWVNMVLSIGSVFLLTTAFMVALVAVIIGSDISLTEDSQPVGSYEHNGMTRPIYDDPLPLVIEDLMEMDGRWSKEMDHQETGLLSYAEYDQWALWTEPREVPNMSYTITEIKAEFLRDYIRKAVLNSRQDEVHGDFVLTDHYEPVDASVWGADEAYQVCFSDSMLNTYLLFWGSRIVEIKFYWEPTAEQLSRAAEILNWG